ncbi:MAG: alanine/glycine:cation symporter family protein [Eubacteriales bacterium]
MKIIQWISSAVGGIVTPFFLSLTAFFLLFNLNYGKILSPSGFIKSMKPRGGSKAGKNSPLRALALALAGTLGVGNITGVTSALISGGTGAVFWMWVGAVLVIGIKYSEVFLAVKYRQRDSMGWFGGAMYYIRDGLGKIISHRAASALGGIFAVLCVMNSLITGNIVQSNAAASVFSDSSRLKTGIILGALVLLSILYGTRKIEKITAVLIPPLAGVYIVIALYFIITNIELVSDVFRDIFRSAFSFRSVYGGAVGFSVREAVRFGVMRGIFSNEAGCGTSPTAHASAETSSPHNQGVCGIAEVIFDTIILCTLTAVVMLIADRKYAIIPWTANADASEVTLDALSLLGGEICNKIISVSIVLFAYATIIAQIYYGTIAIEYISDKKAPKYVYYALSVVCAVVGAVISSDVMWLSADIILGVMTVANCAVIILLRKECR